MDRATTQLMHSAAGTSLVNAIAVVDKDRAALEVRFDDGTQVPALVLSSGLPTILDDGSAVLVLMPEQADAPPIVLGCVTSYADAAKPQDVALEASGSVTLKCGQGSVTLRNDKVLVKGKEVVSRAKGANQVKGGSVSIN
jgi:hypothetical protein